MTKRRGHRRGHGHGRKNKRTMRRRRSHSAHLTRSRRHHRHGNGSRARRGGVKGWERVNGWENIVKWGAKAGEHFHLSTERYKRNEASSRPPPSASSIRGTTFKPPTESSMAEKLSAPRISAAAARLMFPKSSKSNMGE